MNTTINLVQLDLNIVGKEIDNTKNFSFILNKVLSFLKFSHWYAKNYNTHKIIGDLYDSLSDHFDKLQEEIIGTSNQQKISFPLFSFDFSMDNIENLHDKDYLELYYEVTTAFISILNSIEFKGYIDNVVSGINNTKEDILSDINKANYLLKMVNS